MDAKTRKLLEAKRVRLEIERTEAHAKVHQCTGAISMIDSMLAFADAPKVEEVAGQPLNGHDTAANDQAQSA